MNWTTNRDTTQNHLNLGCIVSSGQRDTGLTWDPREGSHRAVRVGQGPCPMRGASLRALAPGQAGVALTV
jgi:hypothetical protein